MLSIDACINQLRRLKFHSLVHLAFRINLLCNPWCIKCEKIMIFHSDYIISYINSRSANAAYGAGEEKKVDYE